MTGVVEGIKRALPAGLAKRLKRLMPARYPAYCPICDTRHVEFWPFGAYMRPNALCPECKGLERHRLLWLLLLRNQLLTEGSTGRLLHFAPERDFGERLAGVVGTNRYISVDISASRKPSVLGDITRLPFADGSFDVAVCSHVLEHIPDDRTAMRECRRVLSSQGWLAVQVPIVGQQTDEDLSVVDPDVRQKGSAKGIT